jgi:hypothetical protein
MRSEKEAAKEEPPTPPLRLASKHDQMRSSNVTIHRATARRTMYRGIPMKSRLEARAAQFLDSVPGVTWAYEPVAYADQTGQYLPDFEAVGLLDVPVLIEVKGAATAEEQAEVIVAMRRIWSSLAQAALAIWTGAVISEGAPFEMFRPDAAPVMSVLRTCAVCSRGFVGDGSDWLLGFTAAVCRGCEARMAA